MLLNYISNILFDLVTFFLHY